MSCLWQLWPRAGIVAKLAFAPPRVTYDAHMPEIEWAGRYDGRPPVPLCYVSGQGAAPDGPVFLFSHGNAEDLGLALRRMRAVAFTFGVDVAVYEYDGYGVQGPPECASEDACYSAIRAVYAHLVEVRRIDPRRIVLYGHSLGTGPTVDLAAHLSSTRRCVDPPAYAGVLLQSPLVSAMRVALPMSVRAMDIFCNGDKVGGINRPVLLIHGARDWVVPHSHTLELAASIPPDQRTVCVVDEAGHNDIELYQTQWVAAVSMFLAGDLGFRRTQ